AAADVLDDHTILVGRDAPNLDTRIRECRRPPSLELLHTLGAAECRRERHDDAIVIVGDDRRGALEVASVVTVVQGANDLRIHFGGRALRRGHLKVLQSPVTPACLAAPIAATTRIRYGFSNGLVNAESRGRRRRR